QSVITVFCRWCPRADKNFPHKRVHNDEWSSRRLCPTNCHASGGLRCSSLDTISSNSIRRCALACAGSSCPLLDTTGRTLLSRIVETICMFLNLRLLFATLSAANSHHRRFESILYPTARAARECASAGSPKHSHSAAFVVLATCFVKIMRPSGLRSI